MSDTNRNIYSAFNTCCHREHCKELDRQLDDARRDLAAANAEREELRKDAERYRWLRDIEGNDPGCDKYMEIVAFTSSREWDAAIDAAIAASKESA